jgi:hypothetical protein
MTADPKAPPRVRDPELMRRLHEEVTECEVTGGRWPLSLHHICRHPRDDLRANLVMVQGDGTIGFHGQLEARNPEALALLGKHIVEERPDTLAYLEWRFWKPGQAAAWLERRYLVGWPT